MGDIGLIKTETFVVQRYLCDDGAVSSDFFIVFSGIGLVNL